MSDYLDSEDFDAKMNDLLAVAASDGDTAVYYSRVITAIREHFEPKRKWVKITDDPASLPKEGAVVLLAVAADDIFGVFRLVYDFLNRKHVFVSGKNYDQEIQIEYLLQTPSAWMQLPDPWWEE